MPIFVAGVGARRAAMRDIGSGARRPPAAKSGIPAGCRLLARCRVAGPCRWARIACGPASNRAPTACNAALLPVRNPG